MLSPTTSEPSSDTSESGAFDYQVLNGQTAVKTLDQYKTQRREDTSFRKFNKKDKPGREQYIQERVNKYVTRHVRQAKAYGNQIAKSYRTLNTIQTEHGGKILKRWRDKAQKERLAILKKANPDIPSAHSNDIEIYQLKQRNKAPPNMVNRDSFLMPQVNQDDLSLEVNLPAFIHSRAVAEPHQYALRDYHRFKWTEGQKLIDGPIEVDDHSIWLGDDKRRYGDMVVYDADNEAATWRDQGTGLDPSSGLLVLETQRKTYDFLVKCCHSILDGEDSNEDIEGDERADDMSTSAAEEPDIAMIDTDTAYQTPSETSLREICDLLNDIYKEAADNLNLIREDPHYFVGEIRRHIDGRMIRKNVRTDGPELDKETLAKVVKEVIRDACRSVILWGCVSQTAYQLVDAMDEDRPETVALHVLQLHTYLCEISDMWVEDLLSSAYDKNLSNSKSPSPDSKQMTKRDKETFKWLLTNLGTRNSAAKTIGLARIADELQWSLDNRDARDHVSDTFANALDYTCIANSCIGDLLVTPEWCSVQDHVPREHITAFRKWMKSWDTLQAKITRLDLSDCVEGCIPLDKKLDPPRPEPPTQTSVEKCRDAERLLDALFKPFGELISSFPESEAAVGQLLRQAWDSFSPRRTSVWVGSTEATSSDDQKSADASENIHQVPNHAETDASEDTQPKQQTVSELEESIAQDSSPAKQTSLADTRTFTGFVTQGEGYTGAKIEPPKKPKEKTRGAPAAQVDPTEETPAPTPPAPFRLNVNYKTYMVFFLLYGKKGDHKGGELKWIDFLYAMRQIGFKPKNMGKGKRFVLDKPFPTSPETTFVEHSPHPAPKYRPDQMYKIAHRLTIHFGFELDTFVQV